MRLRTINSSQVSYCSALKISKVFAGYIIRRIAGIYRVQRERRRSRKERIMQFRTTLRTYIACAAFLVVVFVGHTPKLSAQSTGFVYVSTNNPAGNTVIQYRRAGDGSLTQVAEVATGGLGGTGNGVDDVD